MSRLLLLFLISALPFTVARAGDAGNGAELAARWCATCHVVDGTQRRANVDAPTFHEIASRPGFDEEKVSLFLRDPHPKMPNMNLTRDEAADLAAYIAAQK